MRHLWELEGYSICRILGTSLDENDLKKIKRKLKMDCEDPFFIHAELVSACKQKSPFSKMVERILLRKFCNISLTPQEAFEQIRSGNYKAPIGALMWIACQDKSLEPLTFSIIHMRELEFLKNGKNNSLNEKLKAEIEELRAKIEKLEKKKERLVLERENLRKKVFELAKELNRLKSEKVEMEIKFNRIGGDYAFERIRELEKEVKMLRGEIRKQLKREIKRKRNKLGK